MNYTENLSLGLPEYGESADVADLNRNSGILDAYCYNTRQIECEPYDSTKTYMSGDLAIHNEVICECNTDNTTGTWDDSKWDSTTLAEQIAKAKQMGGESALADLEDVNLTNPSDGQILTYDDTNDEWVNTDMPDASVTKTATGNPIELTDAASAPIVKCVTAITGSQDLHGYDKPWVGGAGKNKFEVTANSQTINGVTFTINSDGTVLVNGTATASTYFTLGIVNLPSGNYTLNGSPSGGGHVASDFVLYVYVGSGENFYDRGNGVEFTGGNDTHVSIAIYNGYTANNLLFKPMIRLSTETDPTFAPYSNICPIVAYTEGEIEVRGKNLFDKSSVTQNYRVITLNGELEYSSGAYASDYTKVAPNTTYTMNFVYYSAANFGMAYYDANKGYISGEKQRTQEGDTSFTFTTPNNCKYIRFTIGSDVSIDNAQLEKGSTATTYEPYTSTTHTTTYPSAIYRGSEDCVNGEVTSEWIKVVFDGSSDEGWTIFPSDNTAFFFCSRDDIPTANWSDVICDKFETIKTSSGRSREGTIWIVYQQIHIHATSAIAPSGVTSEGLAEFKTWLSNNPIEVAFPVNTPTTSSVTPTNLPIKSLSGYNHIESSTGEMEIEYITENYQPLVDLIQSGNGHTYSTQEQVVGTWVDGKTLYEKTLTVTSPTATTVGPYDVYKLGELTGVDVAMFKTGVFIDATDHRNYGLSYDRYYSNTDKMIPEVYVDFQTNTMYAYATCTHSAGFTVLELTMTVQYTKSTTTRSLNASLTSQKAQIETLTDKTEETLTEEEKAVNEEENNDER